MKWTKEQEEIIEKMINESELIGYEQGREELLKEIINELKNKQFNDVWNGLKQLKKNKI